MAICSPKCIRVQPAISSHFGAVDSNCGWPSSRKCVQPAIFDHFGLVDSDWS
jgi:hypothetical protein